MPKIRDRRPLRVQDWVDERDEWQRINELKLYSVNNLELIDREIINKRHERKKLCDRNRKLGIDNY